MAIRDVSFYLGSATSDFQSDPYLTDFGNRFPVSDWEEELEKNFLGTPNVFKFPQDKKSLPQFLRKGDAYIKRSAELGENMFRFSIDFARLVPAEEKFNEDIMDEYLKILIRIRMYGEEPMLTLYHWPMPLYIVRKDTKGNVAGLGWEHPDVLKHFAFFVDHVVSALADQNRILRIAESLGADEKIKEMIRDGRLVSYVITINEPINAFLPHYVIGIFPPYKKWRFDKAFSIITKLVAAHDLAYDAFKNKFGERVRVGVAHHWPLFDGVAGGCLRAMNEYLTNRFERDGKRTDFVGLQYYFRKSILSLSHAERTFGDNPFFGDMYPEGIYTILKRMQALYNHKEIFVTEIGFSDTAGERRPHWILETMRNVNRARSEGVPVSGVLLWTLVNNLEWSFGMQQKFGLFDENDLKAPLVHAAQGIRSWEAWEAIIENEKKDSPEAVKKLEDMRIKALAQFKGSISR